ncbi:sce7726 family protein [Myroides odoratimimus]|uniref:sce7726 family protein n=1 Tax=Myroides odoratimimus TaxID=76832 RepID=UPI002DB6386D|nr:sce7726 family protein [Myroides odoratimimus]MEC4095395.1 sce7726 family protein [Myroides odoratimimus]
MSIDHFSAEYIKTKIIDFFISYDDSIIFGNEVMYGSKRKVVDLLMLNNSLIYGIEIKSSTDNLDRLEEQIEEYKKIFNYIIICTTNKHYLTVQKKISSDIGIILFTGDELFFKRKPRVRKKLDKKEILFSIPSDYLKKTFSITNRKYNSDEIRETLLSQPTKKLQEILYLYLITKLTKNHSLFIKERGIETHIDDIPLLSLRGTKIQYY